MLSSTSRYALQALSYIASNPNRWHDVRRIADVLGTPPNYLSKVLGQLTRFRLLESRKGWGGGFRLRDGSLQVPLADVVQCLQGPRQHGECSFGLPQCSDEAPCPLHGYWKQIAEIYDRMLRELTVADLVSPDGVTLAALDTKIPGSPGAGRSPEGKKKRRAVPARTGASERQRGPAKGGKAR